MILLASFCTHDYSTPQRHEECQGETKEHSSYWHRLDIFLERSSANSAKLRHPSPELLQYVSGEILTALAENPPSSLYIPNHNFVLGTRSLGRTSHVAVSEWWLYVS
jgi:hypothetical protein